MATPAFGRTLDFRTTLSLVIGTIIGSGIFMRPAELAALLGSPARIILAWIIGGTLTMLTTMVIAEIAAMFPDDGGMYAMMRHIYGDFWAYVFGWAGFAVINCAGTAGIAFIFSQYFQYFVPLPSFPADIEKSISIAVPMVGRLYPLEHFGLKMMTLLIITLFTWIGYRSTKSSGRLQVVFTFAKVTAILMLIGGMAFSRAGSVGHFFTTSSVIHPMGFALVAAMMAAINGTLQAYDGTNTMLNLTGEIQDPGRIIPRSLFWGVSVCILIYLFVNLALIYILPIDQMATSELVASDAAQKAFGPVGAGLLTALICLSVLGTTLSNVFTPPRMTFAMARQGLFFGSAGRIHPRFNTPANALLIHWVMMAFMVISGSYYFLTDMYIFIVWFFNLFFLGGIFILRKRLPDAERPYKVWGYPWMPILVFLCNALFLFITVYDDVKNYNEGKTPVMNSVAGLVLTALGIPLYYYFRRRANRS